MALYSYIYLVLLIKCLHGFKLLIKEIYAHVTRDVSRNFALIIQSLL